MSTITQPDLSRFACIPLELTELRRWVLWRFEERDGEPTKIPYQTNGSKAKADDPATWCDYAAALNAYADGQFDGIGFQLGDGYCGVDLDNAIDGGNLKLWAQPFADAIKSYAEKSPSEKGIKLVCKGSLQTDKSGIRRRRPSGEPKEAVEIYQSRRFFTMTGMHWTGHPHTIEDCGEALLRIFAEVDAWNKPKQTAKQAAHIAPDDRRIIDKIIGGKDAAEWARLWNGDTGDYGGDESSADLALCGRIAFFAGPDPMRIAGIFGQSGLTREKWTERVDYRERTIAKALEGKTEFYRWNGDGKASIHVGETKPTRFELTETGMAERVCATHGDDFRYVAKWRRFIVWDGKRWAQDESGAIDRIIKRTIRDTKIEAAKLTGDYGNTLYKFANSCESNSRAKAIAERTTKEPGVVIEPDQLDADPQLFNCDNATLDLRGGGKLLKQNREHLITKLAPVQFDPAAACPTFDLFLEKIMRGNSRLIQFIRRAGGYALTGVTSERCLFMPYGGGRNGKSTLLHAFGAILGDYATTLPAESLLMRRDGGIPNDIARLKGARFVTAIETDEGRRMAESLVKAMTGGTDLLTARPLYGEFFSFAPQFKLWLATNHKPTVRGTDDAIWDRIKLIPFDVRITDEERDGDLPDKLRREYPGILAWLVRGCLEWQADGLDAPDEVRNATQGYRDEMDLLGEFVLECCEIGERLKAGATPLYDAYKTWCILHHESAMTQRRFGSQLGARGYASGNDSSTSRKLWKGIGLKANSEAHG